MTKLVVLTGAGVSAESGLSTFRDSGGLWEGYDVTEVATPEAWSSNPKLVLEFYNERRRQTLQVKPNKAHNLISNLETKFDVTIITQNIDDLHERAGSSNVLHLHGSIFEKRSSISKGYVTHESSDMKMGDVCPDGSQFRPNIVWFGEPVPLIEHAAKICLEAEVFIVLGTSLVVYPAAGLVNYVNEKAPKYIIDPNMPEIRYLPNLKKIKTVATEGMEQVFSELMS